MVTYPITTKRDFYRGRDPRKADKAREFNRVAGELERYINDLLLKQTAAVQSYHYHEIARAIGHDIELVSEICFQIDCGHHGFTAYRKGLTQEQALAQSGDGE